MQNPNEEIMRLGEAFHQAILADLHEGVLSYSKIAQRHGTTVTLVYNVARANHCQRRAGKGPTGPVQRFIEKGLLNSVLDGVPATAARRSNKGRVPQSIPAPSPSGLEG